MEAPVGSASKADCKRILSVRSITITRACGRDVEGQEQIVGFITARLALLVEADALDRKLMSLASPALDGDTVVYLLTIGCLPGLQNQVPLPKKSLRCARHDVDSGLLLQPAPAASSSSQLA